MAVFPGRARGGAGDGPRADARGQATRGRRHLRGSPAAGRQEPGFLLRAGSGGLTSGHPQAAQGRLDFRKVAVPDPTLRTRTRLASIVPSPEVGAWSGGAPWRRQRWGGGARYDGSCRGVPARISGYFTCLLFQGLRQGRAGCRAHWPGSCGFQFTAVPAPHVFLCSAIIHPSFVICLSL